MQRKTFRALKFLCEIFRGSAFVSRRKSHLLKINCLFILVKKQLEQKLSSEKEGTVGIFPSMDAYTVLP